MKRSTSTKSLNEKQMNARRLNWSKFAKISDGSGWTMLRVTHKERDIIRGHFGVCHDGIVKLCSMINNGELKTEAHNV